MHFFRRRSLCVQGCQGQRRTFFFFIFQYTSSAWRFSASFLLKSGVLARCSKYLWTTFPMATCEGERVAKPLSPKHGAHLLLTGIYFIIGLSTICCSCFNCLRQTNSINGNKRLKMPKFKFQKLQRQKIGNAAMHLLMNSIFNFQFDFVKKIGR